MGERLIVNEIFTSIQGESTRSGAPCTFVRLTGCNLRCTYCDTAYAFHQGEERDVEEVAAEVEGHGIRLVTVTGGEPLLQPAVHTLIRKLLDAGYDVQVETSGAVETGSLDPRARVILDVKTPGSGEGDRMLWDSVDRLRPTDEVKFVLVDRRDYEFAREVIRSGRIPSGVPVLLSPAHDSLEPRDLAGWIVQDRVPARLQLQVHKYIWGKEARGV